MNENMEAMQPEAAMPETDTAEDVSTQPTETTAENTADQNTEAATPPETEVAEPEAQPPAPWEFSVPYNHQDVPLTREQTVEYAQMGMRYEALKPTLDTLRLMAAARGQKVPEFINSWSEAEKDALLEKKMQITNGDREAAEILVKAEMDARRQACAVQEQEQQAAEQAAQQTLQDRLAAEFVELQSYFPNVAEIGHLPREVMEEAVNNNRHLYDAYLRYQHREAKKIEENTAAQAAAASASAGSQADQPPVGEMDPATQAAINGVRSVFN